MENETKIWILGTLLLIIGVALGMIIQKQMFTRDMITYIMENKNEICDIVEEYVWRNFTMS